MLPWVVASAIMTASWYGPYFHGRETANGERYNMYGMTAAHKTLPFNTRLKVTYKGKTVVVRINDRGPYIKGRDLDLSYGAAKRLGMTGAGVVTVRVEFLTRPYPPRPRDTWDKSLVGRTWLPTPRP